MFIVPLILGLSAIYVLVYGSVRHSDLPPIDTLGSMQPDEEPRRPAPVAKQADTTPVSVRPQPTSRPRQPRPIPQKDHYNDDAFKKLRAGLSKDAEIYTSASTGQVVTFKYKGDTKFPFVSPTIRDPENRLGQHSDFELVLGPDGELTPLHSAGEYPQGDHDLPIQAA